MSDVEDFEVEHSRPSVTKASLTFLLDGIDPRDLAGDGLSLIDFDSDSEAGGGVREAPTCQELAIEGECLTKQGEHREAIPLLESALELGTDDQQLLSVLWSLLGNAHFYLGDYEKAAQCHAHDLAICNELGDERNQAQAYCNLGIANRKTGYLQRAKLCYERYLDICDKIDDGRSKSKAHHNLGDLHLTLARLKLQKTPDAKLEDLPEVKEHLTKAAECFEKHLEYVRETQNKAAEARVHASLGYVYELLKDADRAIDHHEQRLKLAVEVMDKGGEGRSYCSIGNCLRAMIQPEKALECYTRGLAIASDMDDKTGEGTIHCNMAMTYEMLCNLEEALEHHEKHLEAMQSVDNPYGQAMALVHIAKTYEYMANLNKACETLELLIAVRKQLKQEGELIDTLAKLARLNELRGEKMSKSSGGAGLKNTWKKLKGRKKKQRNLTAPEISPQTMEFARAQAGKPAALDTLEEDKGSSGGGHGFFGKRSKSKEKVNTVSTPQLKKQDSQTSQASPKNKRRDVVGVKDEEILRTESPSSAEDTSLSQKSDSRLPDEQPLKFHNLLKRSTTDSVLVAHSDFVFSESSKLSLSPSGTFAGMEEEPLSTQSSSDANVQISPFHRPPDGSSSTGFLPNGDVMEERTNTREIEESKEAAEDDFRQGCPTLYGEFGDKQHKLNLKRVQQFLESSGEMMPEDLRILQDWDGWVLASKDITIQPSKESQLI